MKSFNKTVSSAGTAERFVAATESDQNNYMAKQLIVVALDDNTGTVVIGDSTVDATSSPKIGIPLAASEGIVLDAPDGLGFYDIRQWYVDAATNDDGISVTIK